MAHKTLPATVALALAALLLSAGQATAYDVQRGDTLWAISRRTGVPVDRIVRDNGLRDPDRLLAGQHLVLPGDAPPQQPVRDVAARRLLVAAAREFGVNPNFVLAVAWWESGYDQGQISDAGAVGLMQLLPSTARWAGPALLGRNVDVTVAEDNARVGAALLRRYLDEFDDPELALAAYYQGERGTQLHGVYPGSQRYVEGIWALRNRLQAGAPLP
ncbi:MAG TPA: transglycosylase SLT domain-containing protein [Candidatus Dormibacteraeota bacterium]